LPPFAIPATLQDSLVARLGKRCGEDRRQLTPVVERWAAWLRSKQTDLVPDKGSSARVSTIHSAIVVRQRFFWIRATDTDIISAQHFWTSGLERLGPVGRDSRAAVSECWL
jgi:hypothetical protein